MSRITDFTRIQGITAPTPRRRTWRWVAGWVLGGLFLWGVAAVFYVAAQIRWALMHISDWEYDRTENDRLLRLHTSILDNLTPCGHGIGQNRSFPQGGCPYCFSRVVVGNCTVLAAHFSARKEAAA